uniref:Papain-like cysteine peptidase n=1 Tax=viral metagenome TaxID=1070528 RepID=A0A6C0AP82_9ZZZZ
MEIKYTCSLGSLCQSSQILKNNNLKKCSYPFDWIFSNVNNILHCIDDGFNTFLDKSYYINISDKQCGHSYYNKLMFNHHNPLTNEDDYNYYVRCVNRFKELLRREEYKLFIMIIVNNDNFDENIKKCIINFNNKFNNYTKNYRLLAIIHIKDKARNDHIFTNSDNIDFLELHTVSSSNGLKFIDENDNDYLNSIIKTSYNFNV